MIDKTTLGVTAEPEEVEAVLHSLCGYHLAEPDPVFRYTVLTREQVLYDALVATIKRERGRALEEIANSGRTLTQIAQMTNLGTRQRVQRLIGLAKAAEQAEAASAQVQAASRDFDVRLAAVEATLDEVVGAPAEPSDDRFAYSAWEPIDTYNVDESGIRADAAEVMRGYGQGGRPGQHRADEMGTREPTQAMPVLAAVLNPARAAPHPDDDDVPWWRRSRDLPSD